MAGPFKIHIHQVGKYNIYPASGPVLDIFFYRQKTASIIQQAVLYKIYSIGGLVQDILNRRSGTRYTQQTVLYKIYSIGGLVQDILNMVVWYQIYSIDGSVLISQTVRQAGTINRGSNAEILKMQSVTYVMKHAQNTNYKLLYYSQFHQ